MGEELLIKRLYVTKGKLESRIRTTRELSGKTKNLELRSKLINRMGQLESLQEEIDYLIRILEARR